VLARSIAHLFGAPAGDDYRSDETSLGAETGAILKVTIAAHQRESEEGADAALIWANALQELEALEVPAEILEQVRSRGAGGGPRARPKDDPETALRPMDREKLANVRKLLKEARASTAWEVLEPLTELYPEEASVVSLACSAAFARKAQDALTRCQHATRIHKGDGQAWLRIGRLQLETEPARAREALDRAATNLKDSDPGWGALARSYQELSLASLALKAAAKSKRASAVVKWAEQSRSRYGSNQGVSEELEGEYLVALQAALKQVYKNDYKGAQLSASSLQKTFPKSIAKDLIDCEVQVRRRKYAAARAGCRAVIGKHAGNAWARYLLGIVNLREKKEAAAILLLGEAIEKDPTLKAAYEALAKVYRPRSDTRLEPLKAKYKQQFGSDLR
jgi:predicted Zn-dependent protease